ncbi:aa3-type cytochrome c oxidase subunit IV [Brevundimonas lutea]|uniref:aa3-type cytochrome c oxidase subunit IV n=1 Tax=Brevundimonas lutea TaxID=2293980 RepID=UPI000F0448D9|nr:aa3-type cytochrome c oxidase subunit IV [Brevundimonas lutea]
MAVTPESPAFPHEEPHVGDRATEHADHDAVAYQRGTMTIEEQSATWSLFQTLAEWGTLISFCLALFAFLILAPGTGFMGAFIPTVVLMVIGGVFLARKPKAGGH